MALSVIVIPGDGVTTQFNIPFSLGYIKESDITARVGNEVDGAGNPVYRALTFLSTEIVEVAGTPAPVGQNIVFLRTVDRTQLIVDFEDGDVINEENMNTAQRQAIMLVHEVLDGRFSQFQSSFDMGGFKITGVGDPTDPQDVATKNYVDARILTGQASAAAAAASAAAALASQNAAASSATAASGSATAAFNSATTATNARDAAITARDAAIAAQTASQAARDLAQTYRNQAETFATNAQGSANAAAASAAASNGSAEYAWVQYQGAVERAAAAAASATAASTSAADADTARSAAQTAQIRAYNWAQAAENTAVNDGVRSGYSAYHWSAKAAASAAAAATFDPSVYVKKAGDVMSGNLLMRNPAAGTAAMVAFQSNTGATYYNLYGGIAADQTFRITNGGGSSLMAMTSAGRAWFSVHGWLDDAFAGKNTYCRHYDGGVLESGSVNPGAGNQTHDIPTPYVMTGLRTIGGNNQTFLRSKPLFNTGG